MRKFARFIGLGCLVLAPSFAVGIGCTHTAERVRFTQEWPGTAGDFEETSEHWTRRGVLRAPLEDQASQLMEVYATYLSTDWRASYVDRQCKLQRMSGERRLELEGEHQESAAKQHEVELLVTTYHPQHNDLHRERSIWRISLVDDSGNEISAQSVERDRRPREIVSAEFDNFGDFAEAYRVVFPAEPAILEGKKFSLRVSSSLGIVEVEWIAQTPT
ncbi:MAG: hypothetical protein GY811_15330 [Myxococcales bacterium]|nr:hypothetical protein [Myxococcales bacterium]